ncbi:MAG: hypothetical protein IAG10_09765 [Planctomycetaceae bacterium]|nr:hypothetical protein [Planctomycetaceae bacterium]
MNRTGCITRWLEGTFAPDALPNALFIGFTGTPIEQNDANTRAVFGEYVSVYDIQQAVIDKATVPIELAVETPQQRPCAAERTTGIYRSRRHKPLAR